MIEQDVIEAVKNNYIAKLKLVSLLYDCDEELCPVMTLIGLNEASKRNNDELLYVFGENCLSILYFCDSQGAENKY